jgi:hypothetical protein
LSLDAWQAAIDNLPDNVFIINPRQRKNALKNKFEAVFNMLNASNYGGAVEKLTNDILKKLDANGKTDWVKQPTLVEGIMAFVGILKSKGGD